MLFHIRSKRHADVMSISISTKPLQYYLNTQWIMISISSTLNIIISLAHILLTTLFIPKLEYIIRVHLEAVLLAITVP